MEDCQHYLRPRLQSRANQNYLIQESSKEAGLRYLSEEHFTFNNIIYEQKDGVSMGTSLGLVLANIIKMECEKVIVDNLVKEGTIVLCSFNRWHIFISQTRVLKGL